MKRLSGIFAVEMPLSRRCTTGAVDRDVYCGLILRVMRVNKFPRLGKKYFL